MFAHDGANSIVYHVSAVISGQGYGDRRLALDPTQKFKFLTGGGEMGTLVRDRDWSKTPLGSISWWPGELRTAVQIVLASPLPTVLAWGPELIAVHNDAYSALLGDRPLALGLPLLDVWTEVRDELGALFTRALAGEAIRTDGAPFLVKRHGKLEQAFFDYGLTPVRDDAGLVVGVLNIAIETTQRVRAVAELRASEEFNRRVLASSADCIKVLNLEGRIEAMSEGGMCVMEVDDFSTIRGTCWSDFWKDDEHSKAIAAVREAKQGGAARFQGFATTMKGSPRWWDVAVTPINGADGRPEKLLSVSRDVTASKHAEKQLRKMNETLERQVADRTVELRRFWDIVDANTSPICAFDSEHRLIAFNSAHRDEFQRISGFQPKIGDVFPDLFLPEQRPVMRALMDRALTGERFTVTEEFGRPEFGVPTWEISYTPLRDDGGEIIGAFHLATDISDRLRAEADLKIAQEALRQSQKMEAMGQLTGGVAHDFNNLLTPIVGVLDMLQRAAVGGEREQRLIAGAAQSAERARLLVQRLLAFARRQPLQPIAVDIAHLITGMADLVASTTGPKIRVMVEMAGDLPPAKADPNQLEMAILNLAVNARDAMPDGGTLTISASANVVRASATSQLRSGHYVRVSVIDTGIGMDEKTLTRATEPFFSTKGVGKGTGLGLSMVHGLASQLGGELRIRSKQGLGSTIELWLPQAERAAEPLATAHTSQPIRGVGTALLVDDEEIVRLSTADMLADLGYDVVEAESAEEALRIVQEGIHVDLVVTDHLMPGISGTDLAHILADEQPGLPVLIVSGFAEVDGVAPDLPRLTKPFRKDELAASLAGLFSAN